MAFLDFLQEFGPTIGFTAASAAWLTKSLIGHGLNKDLEKYKSDLQTQLDSQKTELEAKTKQQVETILADRGADREYNLEARKRLYLAIGPLRFQLLLACRDLSGRIQVHARERYETNITSYYGKSTFFRILRPLTITELIERQISYADFSVDAGATELLRFKKNAFATFSGASVVGEHPQVNWIDQEQHVFFDNLTRAADALIVADSVSGARCARFSEFEEVLSKGKNHIYFEPLAKILADFSPEKKPLFWTRLVAYGYLCNDYINRVGAEIGFERRDYPLKDLLEKSGDSYILSNIQIYESNCRAQPARPL